MNAKIIAIIGPTASGKSSLGIKLAQKFGGEIISADSRQVYRGLDIGSAKIKANEMRGVPHHLLDVADPATETFTLARYLKLSRQAVNNIWQRGRLPFVVGGTGLYVTALLEGYSPPNVPPNKKLRAELQKLSVAELQNIYQNLDPQGFKKIDKNNPQRLMRAIEVVKVSNRPFFGQTSKVAPEHQYLLLGLSVPWEKLKENIRVRLHARFPAMLDEVVRLNEKGVSWERLEGFGLEYKGMTKLAIIKNESKSTGPSAVASAQEASLTKAEQEILQNLESDIIAYARRQLTWWRKRDVIWIKNYTEAKKEIQKFLAKDQ